MEIKLIRLQYEDARTAEPVADARVGLVQQMLPSPAGLYNIIILVELNIKIC